MQYDYDVLVLGTGMGSLAAASLLAKENLCLGILEQNYLPGGCTSSYARRGYVFEAGATTLVGLDEHMPLRLLLDETGIALKARKLPLPMQVHFAPQQTLNRYENFEEWLREVTRFFPEKGQEAFWRWAYRVSQFVWENSTQQLYFPPRKFTEFVETAKGFRPTQLLYAPLAFRSTAQQLKKFDLYANKQFRQFIDEQLLITAQNHAEEVNGLFGGAALSYTNYGNYYVDGGLINLVQPFLDYLEGKGAEVMLRRPALKIETLPEGYRVHSRRGRTYTARRIISGLPLNSLPEIWEGFSPEKQELLPSEKLNSAFQLSLAFRRFRDYDSLHHQIHLREPLPQVGSRSIFLSLSHPEDLSRSPSPDIAVASVSTHIPNPEANMRPDKEIITNAILKELEAHNLVKKENIVFQHASVPSSWQRWTQRSWGFVGGYPQFLNRPPWKMNEARLDEKGAYLCGDTAYPGQGIPGVTLSGIIAAKKLLLDS